MKQRTRPLHVAPGNGHPAEPNTFVYTVTLVLRMPDGRTEYTRQEVDGPQLIVSSEQLRAIETMIASSVRARGQDGTPIVGANVGVNAVVLSYQLLRAEYRPPVAEPVPQGQQEGVPAEAPGPKLVVN